MAEDQIRLEEAEKLNQLKHVVAGLGGHVREVSQMQDAINDMLDGKIGVYPANEIVRKIHADALAER